MTEVVYSPIGVIHSPFTKVEGMPIQSRAAAGVKGSVRLNPNLVPGLKDIEGFSHLILLYHFHLSKPPSLEVTPFLDDTKRGVFATRVPSRPNSIGISIVKLIGVSGTILSIEDVDIIDGTPLLDIKPFVPYFDNRETQKVGWFTKNASKVTQTKSDRRFAMP